MFLEIGSFKKQIMSSPKFSTLKFKMFKWDLLSLKYANTLSSKPKESNKPLTWFATVALVMYFKDPNYHRGGFRWSSQP